ncbi:unnamed protein product, partial [Rotaria sp. Silwood1]
EENNRIMRWPKGATQGSVIVGGNGKRRGQNRPSSPISTNNSQIIKRILIPQSNLNLSSSSSQSLDDERKRSSNERRRQR